MRLSKRVIIVEGPDGAGKTTLARALCEQLSARYEHFGPLPQFKSHQDPSRLYAEAMLPAVHGHQHVVMDRSWLSERPYGKICRNGENRISMASQRMLERLAMRCGAVVVLCKPPIDRIIESYARRKQIEYASSEEIITKIYYEYNAFRTELPVCHYDYTLLSETFHDLSECFNIKTDHATPLHPISGVNTVGNYDAKVLLVGDKHGEHKPEDPWYQWPFASFSNQGCSRPFTWALEAENVAERDLLWVNADQPLHWVQAWVRAKPGRQVVALGEEAAKTLSTTVSNFTRLAHPMHWARFHRSEPCGSAQKIKELTQ